VGTHATLPVLEFLVKASSIINAQLKTLSDLLQFDLNLTAAMVEPASKPFQADTAGGHKIHPM